jgi:hypothetical protein
MDQFQGLEFNKLSSWVVLMAVVEIIEDLGYAVTICKFSCSIKEGSTNKTIVKNTNQFRLKTKKEAVVTAMLEFIRYYKSIQEVKNVA